MQRRAADRPLSSGSEPLWRAEMDDDFVSLVNNRSLNEVLDALVDEWDSLVPALEDHDVALVELFGDE